MQSKPSGCTGCPLEHKGKGFCPDMMQPNADYIMFGEAPGTTEIGAGKPFQGKAGFVLKEWLMKAVPQLKLADERKKVSYMNVLKCLPPEVQGRPYPKGQEKLDAERHCSQYMDLGNAKTVILCGESPQRYFFGEELNAEDATDRGLGHDVKGVMGRIGREYEKAWCPQCRKTVTSTTRWLGYIQQATSQECPDCMTTVTIRRWVFAPHPAYILRQPALVQHGQEALRIGVNCETIAHPQQVEWTIALKEIN